jgi:hypothetical protein
MNGQTGAKAALAAAFHLQPPKRVEFRTSAHCDAAKVRRAQPGAKSPMR